MSENKLIMKLAVSQAFTAGVLATLILTGSIKTHFLETATNTLPADQGQSTTAPIGDTLPKTKDNSSTTLENTTPGSDDAVNSLPLVNLLKNNIEELKVVPDRASDEEARKLLYAEFSSGPSITQGQGKKNVYILFDPLCPHCHDLFKDFERGLLQNHDLTAHWIPAVAFLQNPKSMEYSQKLVSAVLAGQEDNALRALHQMMIDGDFSILESNNLSISTAGILRVARNTVGLLQAGTGTPTLVYENSAGSIEIVEGTPSESDLKDVR